MKKFKYLIFIFSLAFLFTNPAQAQSIKHSMNFDAAYTYLFTKPRAHMGTFGIGYGLKTSSNITFGIMGYGGYGKLLNDAEISGFSVAGMQVLPGYALDLTDSIYVNLSLGFAFSFTSSKVAVSIKDEPASIVSLKMPVRLDFVFNVMDHFDIVSGIEYSPLWQNVVSVTNPKLQEKEFRFANEIALILSFKYVF